jgi:hypothetical protein
MTSAITYLQMGTILALYTPHRFIQEQSVVSTAHPLLHVLAYLHYTPWIHTLGGFGLSHGRVRGQPYGTVQFMGR